MHQLGLFNRVVTQYELMKKISDFIRYVYVT